jgi:hypothetical protein
MHHRIRRPRFAGVSLVASLMLLAACADSPSAPIAAPATPRAAALAATTVEKDVPVHLPLQIPCGRLGREIVPMDGTEHVTTQWMSNANGGGHLRMHITAQADGIGLVSGDSYKAEGTTNETYEFDIASYPFQYDLTYNFNVQSAGKSGNIVAHEVLRVNVDTWGNATYAVIKFDAECR